MSTRFGVVLGVVCGGVSRFAFGECPLSPFAQVLPLLFDTDGAFEDIDTAGASEFRHDVYDGTPESLRLLVGFDEGRRRLRAVRSRTELPL